MGAEVRKLREAQAAGELVIISSADAVKFEHEPLYLDRRGEEDITCAGVIVFTLIPLLLFVLYLIMGVFRVLRSSHEYNNTATEPQRSGAMCCNFCLLLHARAENCEKVPLRGASMTLASCDVGNLRKPPPTPA